MQSEAGKILVDLEAYDSEKSRPRSFDLYEEYSHASIDETINTRRDNFDKADSNGRKELEAEVAGEVEDFRVWLEETKNLESDAARYCAISLRSLLLGLPVGVQVACLFDAVLNNQIGQ